MKKKCITGFMYVILILALSVMLCACNLISTIKDSAEDTDSTEQNKEDGAASTGENKDDGASGQNNNNNNTNGSIVNDSLTEAEIKTLLLDAEVRLAETHNAKYNVVYEFEDDDGLVSLETTGSGESYIYNWFHSYDVNRADGWEGYEKCAMGKSGDKYLFIVDDYDSRDNPQHKKNYSELTREKFFEKQNDLNFGQSFMCDTFGETWSEVTINDLFERAESNLDAAYSGTKLLVGETERYELAIECKPTDFDPVVLVKISFVIEDGQFVEVKTEAFEESNKPYYTIEAIIEYNYSGLVMPSTEGFKKVAYEDVWTAQ